MKQPGAAKPAWGRTDTLICMALLCLVFAVYGQVVSFDFVNFDDELYVVKNPQVKAGLTPESISWAFLFKDRRYLTYWHPLTWLSHMLDVELFGLDAGWHHLSGLIFHVANSLLLFALFKQMTGKRWQSAGVALLFALHPLNVESVAWVAARKNVLSTFFWLMTMRMYVAYAARPELIRYLLTLLLFILGLMAKPMLVTLPFVLLLLDVWPLKRLRRQSDIPADPAVGVGQSGSAVSASAVRLLLEKLPLLLLALAAAFFSTSALRSLQTVATTDQVAMGLRLENAIVTYVKYIFKLIWPRNLAYYYPYPDRIDGWQVVCAVLLLTGMTFAVLRLAARKPYLTVGWLWYLGTLVPVSGIFQAGLWPEMADRWAYVPTIGLFIVIAWGCGEIWDRRPRLRIFGSLLAGVVLAALAASTWQQLQTWQNSTALFKRAIAATGRNMVAHLSLGAELERAGRKSEAMRQYQHALRLNPYFAGTYVNIGTLLAGQGHLSDAVEQFKKALSLDPRASGAHFNLAKILAEQGKWTAAIHHYAEVLRLAPDNVKAYNNLANLLAARGRLDEAVRIYSDALKIEPDSRQLRDNLAQIQAVQQQQNQELQRLLEALKKQPGDYRLQAAAGELYKRQRRWSAAINHYRAALKIEPHSLDAIRQLGLLHALKGDYESARRILKKELEIQPDSWFADYYIAATYARQNKRPEAIQWLKKAVKKGFDKPALLSADENFEQLRDTAYYRAITRTP